MKRLLPECIPVLAIALSISGCIYIPGSYGTRSPTVSGQLLDSRGEPIEGAVVHAVQIQSSGGGNFHNSPKWYDVKRHDRFTSIQDGTFSGRLDYTDNTLSSLSDKAVFYYVCKEGFQTFPLYRPKYRTSVMRRLSEPAYNKIPLEYSMAIRSGGCN